MTELTYWEARARALFRGLDSDPSIVLFGGLVSLPFNPDDGLLSRYPDRVIWSPISEFAAAGVAVGAAMHGLRPLVAVGTSSFMFHAWPAIVNEAPNIRYLSAGKTTAPVVFHVMAGSRRHGGAQHEHTPQAMLQNVPGLRVLIPGSPADIDAIFADALTGEDPVVIIDHVLLGEARGKVAQVPDPLTPIVALRDGDDVLIVASSVMTQRALAAAEMLENESVSAAVLGVRVIAPSPADEIARIAAGYQRVVFVDESRGPGSPVSSWAARLAESASPQIRLAVSADVPAPYAGALLDRVVPTTESICAAVRSLS